ncbi:MAG: CDGSH iron-sulfur domain-containing protein [Gammaproteobacteria bacterium]|nr:CDGSH iron-sulfur domain-containing protein [Gammaproteobacteria bacterium]MBQ0773115.1 CDGSH iron-sulfur domain-containing protein [Gammaproteobacteria bacterium]
MTANVASTLPYPMEVKKGQRYLFCACGRSDTQPYCNRTCADHSDSHLSASSINVSAPHEKAPADFPEAITYVAGRDQIVFFCGCKQSAKLPICDGSHIKLTNRAPR